MFKNNFLVFMAFTAGLLGGFFSNYFFDSPPVLAGEEVEVLAARKFVVKDDIGNIRAILGPHNKSAVGLWLFDGNETLRAAISLASPAPRLKAVPLLQFYDERFMNRVSLVGANQTQSLSFQDKWGQDSVSISSAARPYFPAPPHFPFDNF